eukprot:5258586-Prorocentrum_lima.AAC.1
MGNVGVFAKLHQTGNELPYWPFNVVEEAIRKNNPADTENAAVRNLTWQRFTDWTQGVFDKSRKEDGPYFLVLG